MVECSTEPAQISLLFSVEGSLSWRCSALTSSWLRGRNCAYRGTRNESLAKISVVAFGAVWATVFDMGLASRLLKKNMVLTRLSGLLDFLPAELTVHENYTLHISALQHQHSDLAESQAATFMSSM